VGLVLVFITSLWKLTLQVVQVEGIELNCVQERVCRVGIKLRTYLPSHRVPQSAGVLQNLLSGEPLFGPQP